MSLKKCGKCQEFKELDKFGKKASTHDGVQARCFICRKEEGILRYYKYKDTIKRNVGTYNRKRRQNPEEVEKDKLKSVLYRRTEHGKQKTLNYRTKNKDKIAPQARANCAKRRSLLLKRITGWSELEQIREFYRKCPKGHHVDHIYPLRGSKVSGLHVLANLQYLPAEENLSKSNKMPEEFASLRSK